MNNLFTAPLAELREYEELRSRMRKTKGLLSLTGCVEAQKAHMIHGLSFDVPYTVVVAENELSAKTLYENLRFYVPDALYYPAKDLLFYQADVASNLLDQQRLRVFRALLEKEKVTLVLPVTALMDFVTLRAAMEAEKLIFRWGEESDFEAVKRTLVLLGYERCAETAMPGQFAFRGDILDIWPLTEEHPVRIEFFGDEVDSMRSFDAESQRSIEEIQEIGVYPAHDHTGTLAPFLTWFPLTKTQFFLDEPNRLVESAAATETEFRESVKMRAEAGSFNPDETPKMSGVGELQGALNRLHCIALSMLDIRREGWDVAETYGMTVQSAGAYNNSFDYLAGDLARYRKRGFKVVVLSASHTRAKRLAAGLLENGVPAFSEKMGL